MAPSGNLEFGFISILLDSRCPLYGMDHVKTNFSQVGTDSVERVKKRCGEGYRRFEDEGHRFFVEFFFRKCVFPLGAFEVSLVCR